MKVARNNWELAILLGAFVAPWFAMANTLRDGDEVRKLISGGFALVFAKLLVSGILSIYKTWKGDRPDSE